MRRMVKMLLTGAVYASLFFSTSDFNQVSARIPDTRGSGSDGMYRSQGADFSGEQRNFQDNRYARDRRDFRDDRYYQNRGYGVNYEGGPSLYYGDGNPGYTNNYYYSQPDNTNDNSGSYTSSPQQMDGNLPYNPQMDGNRTYSQPNTTTLPSNQSMNTSSSMPVETPSQQAK